MIFVTLVAYIALNVAVSKINYLPFWTLNAIS